MPLHAVTCECRMMGNARFRLRGSNYRAQMKKLINA